MAGKNEVLEIEEAVDIFSELRAKHEQNSLNTIVVHELIRLELSLHERARLLRNAKKKPVSKKKIQKRIQAGDSENTGGHDREGTVSD
jgi:hypothetical protein